MHREKMAGVNLREGSMEVALEQWTEPCFLSRIRLQRIFHVTGKQYSISSVLSE